MAQHSVSISIRRGGGDPASGPQGSGPQGEMRIAYLPSGAQLFVWSVRRWHVALMRRESIEAALGPVYRVAKCMQGVALFDELMSLVAVAAFRPPAVRCMCSATLSADERDMLLAVQAAWRGCEEAAVDCIGTIVAGRLRHAFCRSATCYADALRAAAVPLCGVRLHLAKS